MVSDMAQIFVQDVPFPARERGATDMNSLALNEVESS